VTATGSRQTLILIHGRSARLSTAALLSQWRTALERGLERDYPQGPELNQVRVQQVYYGDLLEQVRDGGSVSSAVELADRENALQKLVAMKSRKKFRRVNYEALPGKNRLKEFAADIGAPLSTVLGLGEKRIRKVMPELISYWDNVNGIRDEVQSRLRTLLIAALERDDRVMVLAHCLGSVVAYDTFWGLSQQPRSLTQRVDTWVTLGSPLADNYVRHRLAGGKSVSSTVSYPDIVNTWLNVAAEDDYVCHDETMANDFQVMLDSRLISRIQDYRIYNLTERYGRSNPHGALGYLIHPRMSKILSDWITAADDT